VQELGALGVWSVLGNGGALGPSDKRTAGGLGELDTGDGPPADLGGESEGVRAVAEEGGDWGGGAADPARVLREEGIEPGGSLVLQAVNMKR
jgi:hypothetical protein